MSPLGLDAKEAGPRASVSFLAAAQLELGAKINDTNHVFFFSFGSP